MLTSIFSAGNTYTYAATRNLYSLAVDGRAPAFLRKTTGQGVPIYCFLVVMCFPFLSFLQLSNGSNQVLTWLINIITAAGVIDYIIMCVTYLHFYRACQVQNVDRTKFPYYAYFQPYSAWIGLVFMTFVVIFFGYSSFTPWSISSFFTYYTMVLLAPVFFFTWKLLKGTKRVKPEDADLVWERPAVETYEATFINPPIGFWTEIFQLVGYKRHLKDEQKIE